MVSTDGSVSRLFTVGANGICPQYLTCEVPKNPVTGWTDPWLSAFYSTYSSTVGSITTSAFSSSARYVGRANSTDFIAYLGGEGYNGTLISTLRRQNSYSGKFCGSGISVVSETTGAYGRLGELYDCWWWSGVNLDTSSMILWPNGTSRTHIQVGDMLFPWNGTLPDLLLR